MEDQWLNWIKRIEAIAATGLHFSGNEYDRERYEEIQRIAWSMLCTIAEAPPARIAGLVSDSAKGYVTPKVDVRGAIIRDRSILLVRETSDGRWTLPGGFADVGLSPSQNVLKEIREEAGLEAEIIGLYGIRHKAKQSYEPDLRDFYKLFFLCRDTGRRPACPGTETSEIGYFRSDRLPPLSPGRVIESDIHAAFAFAADRSAVLVD